MRKFACFKLSALLITLISSLPKTQSSESDPFKNLYSECNQNKLCLVLPLGCAEKKDCVMIFANSYDTSSKEAIMEIAGKVTEKDRYFAMGISDNKIMGDTSVTECSLLSNNEAVLRTSWNHQQYNIADDHLVEVSHAESSFKDGVVFCKWHRSAFTSVRHKKYDLEKEDYHLMLAKGNLVPGKGKCVKN